MPGTGGIRVATLAQFGKNLYRLPCGLPTRRPQSPNAARPISFCRTSNLGTRRITSASSFGSCGLMASRCLSSSVRRLCARYFPSRLWSGIAAGSMVRSLLLACSEFQNAKSTRCLMSCSFPSFTWIVRGPVGGGLTSRTIQCGGDFADHKLA